MEEDAFDVAARYTNAGELIQTKNYHRKDGKVDMCTAIKEMIEDGIAEGREKGIAEEKTKIITKLIKYGMSETDIREITGCDQEMIDTIRKIL